MLEYSYHALFLAWVLCIIAASAALPTTNIAIKTTTTTTTTTITIKTKVKTTTTTTSNQPPPQQHDVRDTHNGDPF